jgi:general secretion pathway protein D
MSLQLMRQATRASALLACLLIGACASGARDRAQLAERAEDFDRAVAEYTRALQERPDDPSLRRDLERAKLRAAQQHYAEGRRHAGLGNYDEALVEYQIAAEMNPLSGEIQDAVRDTRRAVQTRLEARADGQTELEALVERTRALPPSGLELPEDTLPESLVFRDASSRDVFSALGQFAGVNVVFDPTFSNEALSIDLRGSTLTAALTAVAASTRNFYRVTAPQTVTVIPDTPAKRREYEEEVVQTFYLSNADVAETIDMLRLVIDLRRLAPMTATRAISIKDTPQRLAAAGRLIAAIDKARPEVVIDVELLEVDRQRLREYGLQFASPGSPGIDGFATLDQTNLTLDALGSLTRADVFVANLPGLFYRLLKRDANTRTLANPHLRTSEGTAATARFGQRVPVPVTTFAPFATGGIQQQPITSFNYENIGVNIDITPFTHHNDDVSLDLAIEVQSVSGTGFGDLPTFGNRSITTSIRLRDGETNILAGLIRDDEREVMEGIPGLSDLPIIGRLFARSQQEIQETDIIVTLTPRIIRVLDLDESDLRAFRVERDSGAGLDINAPLPTSAVPGAMRPGTSAAPPGADGAGPIRALPLPSAPPPDRR